MIQLLVYSSSYGDNKYGLNPHIFFYSKNSLQPE